LRREIHHLQGVEREQTKLDNPDFRYRDTNEREPGEFLNNSAGNFNLPFAGHVGLKGVSCLDVSCLDFGVSNHLIDLAAFEQESQREQSADKTPLRTTSHPAEWAFCDERLCQQLKRDIGLFFPAPQRIQASVE